MPFWQELIIAWVVLWGLQAVGTWYQMRSYRSQVAELQQQYSTGYMGTGHAAKRFGAGAIVMIVTDEALKVTSCVMMRGLTFLAKFKPLPDYVGQSIDEMQAALQKEPEKSSLRMAATSAINQILRVKRERETAQQAAPAIAPA